MDLIDFLRQRLDEDEAAARKAEGTHWRTTSPYLGSVDVDDVKLNRSVIMDREGGAMSEETGAHVARWDPARVLAEVDAKREIIRMFEVREEQSHLPGADVVACHATGLLLAIRQFVRPYADHPDFDPAWVAA